MNLAFSNRKRRLSAPVRSWVTTAALLAVLTVSGTAQVATQIEVSFNKLISHEAVDGSVYLLISRNQIGEPREALRQGPFDGIVLRRDVTNLHPFETVVFDATVPGYPTGLSGLEPGRYGIQAILDINRTLSDFTIADGNGRSGTQRLDLGDAGTLKIVMDDVIVQPRREDVGRIRYRYLESRIVGRQISSRVFLQTAILMPLNYKPEDHRSYPVQYWIPGLGEDTRSALKYFQKRGVYLPPFGASPDFSTDFIIVLLQPHAGSGFHGFMDSAGHGAFRESLFDEIIPAIEEEFPVIANGSGRYLVGKGAGALAALRLQAENPNEFAGVWALAPDPVSHRDFFGLDLSDKGITNAFTTAKGRERTLVRKNGKAVLSMREQAHAESVIRSGQLFQSYNAMYAPLAADFRPAPLFDLTTGEVNRDTAKAYMRHDFLANLEANWDQYAESLRGKFHVLVGDDDDFYLHRGVTALKLFLDGRDSTAQVKILPGKSYADMDDPKLHLKIQNAILADWRNKSSSN